MGYGDKLMAIGDAWAMHQRDPMKRKVAIGDGRNIDKTDLNLTWGLEHFLATQEEVDAGYPINWVISYPGNRPYIDYGAVRSALVNQGIRLIKPRKMIGKLGRYIFDLSYRPRPAPIKLTPEEEAIAAEWAAKGPFVLIEGFTKARASPNKQWPVDRFREVARTLKREIPVYQIGAAGTMPLLPSLPQIRPESFRQSLAYLKAASLYIGPEGGLHHGSRAMNTRAVVIYGGFTSPLITGYPDLHINLTGDNEGRACGSKNECMHCTKALQSISAGEVLAHARRQLEKVHAGL
ncbi:hypothetical protein HOU00_gp448 [Caulobacter phage CcrPW]|uniref:Glycosyltransferase family 9 protein n=1 Tax=Caulobacter phage CcrPW TaxID=2283271 RepID=A0A385ECY0_9CAUD|nr:hypothetical protein HOU00_gp448 [Caulobacter phage CcrPW]AXQ68677.1 hypothetical protein CcrPW_gp138 [Caulobacter phage CcrPW]